LFIALIYIFFWFFKLALFYTVGSCWKSSICETLPKVLKEVIIYWAKILSKLTLMMVPWLLSTEVVVGVEEDWLGQAAVLVVEQREAAVGQESLQSLPQLGVPSHCSFLS